MAKDELLVIDRTYELLMWCFGHQGNNARCDIDRDFNITLNDALLAKDLNGHTVACP